MKSKKITDGDINDKKVASLPTRPTAPAAFGGKGYTATELKEAFDSLPLFLVEKYNELISDILGENGGGLTDTVKTGINGTQTLADFFSDVLNGNLITYLAAPNGSLAEYLIKLRADVDKIAAKVKVTL